MKSTHYKTSEFILFDYIQDYNVSFGYLFY